VQLPSRVEDNGIGMSAEKVEQNLDAHGAHPARDAPGGARRAGWRRPLANKVQTGPVAGPLPGSCTFPRNSP